jgi:glycogen synthase
MKQTIDQVISRLVSQKGFDMFSGAINDLMKLDAQFIILAAVKINTKHSSVDYRNIFPGRLDLTLVTITNFRIL